MLVWKAVARLDIGGVWKFEESTNGYNKMQTYISMFLDPTRNLRNRLDVGGLTAEDRMLVYLITYILTPRSNNPALKSRILTTNSYNSIPRNSLIIN